MSTTTHYEIRAWLTNDKRPGGGTMEPHWGRFGLPERNRDAAEHMLTIAAASMPNTRVGLVEVVQTETTVKEITA